MCGICGILNFDTNNAVNKDALKRMTDIMFHRGPDDEGFYINNNIGLGFRRLSIIDLAGGHQPMCNETGDVWIVFNGEIYNHADIRKHLIAKGHVYKTRTDTETLIHLYEQEGIDGIQKVNGMFGIAIWDDRVKRLILIRDRLGIKPIYYAQLKDSLLFASEVKSIMENRSLKAELNEGGLGEQLVFRYMAGEDTLFRNVKKLLPGHLLIWENGQTKIVKYWDVEPPETYTDIDEQQAMDQLEEMLKDSVKLRLMSDVPLGTFCSGGVDSGLTTAFARECGNSELNTFSIGFYEEAWDETRYAEMMAKRFNTIHHVVKIDNKSYADSVPKLIWYHDDPLYHPSSTLVFTVSKLARQFVTVVLTGEGSDEMFGGYPRFLIPRECSRLQFLPVSLRRAMSQISRLSSLRRFNKLAYFLPLTLPEMAIFNSQYALPEMVNSLLNVNSGLGTLDYRYSLLGGRNLTPTNVMDNTMYVDLKTYIPAALHRQDKMSMANSLESRVPFLDYRLVEWALRVPAKLKINRHRNKYLVKKLGDKFLPREAIYRPKVGFGVPINEWLLDKKGMGRYLDMFYEPAYKQRGYINVKRVHGLVDEHLAKKANHCEILWNLINLELWQRIFIEKSYNI